MIDRDFIISVYFYLEDSMKLDFYDVDKNYIEFLQNAEFDARGYTCVPNMEYGNRNQKFLCGIVLKVGQFNYYVPVTSYKKQQSENILIKFEKDKKNPIKGSLRFNYMIPVPDEFIHVRKINAEPKLERRIFLAKQLRYIQSISDKIEKQALRTYNAVVKGYRQDLKQFACDFKLLEEKCAECQEVLQNYEEIGENLCDGLEL